MVFRRWECILFISFMSLAILIRMRLFFACKWPEFRLYILLTLSLLNIPSFAFLSFRVFWPHANWVFPCGRHEGWLKTWSQILVLLECLLYQQNISLLKLSNFVYNFLCPKLWINPLTLKLFYSLNLSEILFLNIVRTSKHACQPPDFLKLKKRTLNLKIYLIKCVFIFIW